MRFFSVVLLFLISLPAFTQKVIVEDTFYYKGNFNDYVKNGMKKYNNSYKGNAFYNLNVVKDPLFENDDSIIYNVKLITNVDGMLLWGSKGKFAKLDSSKGVCEINDIKLLKKSQFMSGVSY